MQAARRELVDTLKSVITDSADDILSKTLSKLSESPSFRGRQTRDVCFANDILRLEFFRRTFGSNDAQKLLGRLVSEMLDWRPATAVTSMRKRQFAGDVAVCITCMYVRVYSVV